MSFIWCLAYLAVICLDCGPVGATSYVKKNFDDNVKNVFETIWGFGTSLDWGKDDKGDFSNITMDRFQKCFKDPRMIVTSDPDYYDRNKMHINDPLIRVLGITTDCLVYFGWLTEIYNARKQRTKLPKGFTNACKDVTPFIMRSENSGRKQLLFLAIKTYGRRVMVQSIASEHSLFKENSDRTGGVIWMRMNPYARHEQFLSNEFPPDFTYDAFVSMYYRVFIMGHSSSGTKILEMKVAIDRNGNLVPYITSLVLHVDPLIHAPLFGTSFIAKFDFRWDDSSEIKRHGFVFIRQLYDGEKPVPGTYKSVGAPMESILTRSFRKISPIMRYRGHIFSSNNVTLYNNKKCSFLGYVRMSRQLAIKIWSSITTPPAELELSKVTKRRFFNHFRFHRRMSYPHTIHRAQRHNIFLAWCQVLPGVIVNCVLLGLIVYGIQKCINWNEIRKARRSGLSRSYSANTF